MYKIKSLLIFGLSGCILSSVVVASALMPEPLGFDKITRKADLIFVGVVTDVRSRLSDRKNQDDIILPYTFVTFQIERALKGASSESNTVTLRFLGGPGKKGAYLKAPDVPLFRVGERNVLFVRSGEKLVSPLAGGVRGRYRVVKDLIYSNEGLEIRLDGKQVFYGPYNAELAASWQHALGRPLVKGSRPKKDDKSLKIHPTPIKKDKPQAVKGTHATLAAFANLINTRVLDLHTTGELKALTPVVSLDVTKPFYITGFKPVKPPQTYTGAPSNKLDAEQKAYLENRNPVLKKNPMLK